MTPGPGEMDGARAGRVARLAVGYCAVVFAVGFALGTVRVVWLVPRVGERAAELAETPLMVAASWLAARWLFRGTELTRRAAATAGGLALALLVGIEATVVLRLRGPSFPEYLASRDPVSGAVYALSLLVFAAMPALVVGRPRSRR